MNAAVPSPEALAALEAQLLELLSAEPAGFGEHALLKRLRESNALFADFDARQPLSLFRGHFLLFHALYRVRDRLRRERRGGLIIDPLRVVLKPWSPEGSPAQTADLAASETESMRAWYGDWERWRTATADDVIGWLRQFQALRRCDGQRAAALAVLGLQDPVDRAAIKRQYRRLAMQHHPDRGGDGSRLRDINAAWAVLHAASGA